MKWLKRVAVLVLKWLARRLGEAGDKPVNPPVVKPPLGVSDGPTRSDA